MQNTTVKYRVDKNGDLQFVDPAQLTNVQEFVKTLKPGTIIDVYYSAELDPNEKTLGQLAKVDVLKKQLAKDIGYTPLEMKNLVKHTAGLHELDDEEKLKSFSDCTKTELTNAIQACIEIGNTVGSNIY